jgi:hypothetical protein
VAALSGQCTGEPTFPVGISTYWFMDPEYCDKNITFYPTGTTGSCAGWNTFDQWPASVPTLTDILTGLTPDPPTVEPPTTTVGETEFMYNGGTLASVFEEMQALYDAKKDPITGEWETKVVVYDSPDCSNPNQAKTVVGFATATITAVYGSPTNTIMAEVDCKMVSEGQGGCGNFGTLGTIPHLVK